MRILSFLQTMDKPTIKTQRRKPSKTNTFQQLIASNDILSQQTETEPTIYASGAVLNQSVNVMSKHIFIFIQNIQIC